MKKIVLSNLFICLILLTSCGGNNENNLIENPQSVKKLIKQITIQNPKYPDYYNSDQFIYENGKLIKAWFYGCSGGLYEFEYGSNGKISIVYKKYGVSYSDIGISIKTSGEITKHLYNDEDNLITVTDDLGVTLASLDYDSNGRLYKINKIDNKFANGSLGTVIFSDFDDNNNPINTNFDLKYSYDNKVNPIYTLFKEFGFFNIEMCNSLDERRVFYISPNNVKEIIRTNKNNKIIFSSIYSYDADDYPTSNSFIYNDGVSYSRTEKFEY
ncbi:RHS repeat domain-containing protein [Tenacibaculum finnmarkense]|uniref:RHS repeat domain-containing protein n=1 Tax=Tenacibaculum finnmarkense TaxID=2781243 RepID=UPI001E405A16|nr:RHS repeat domain-containing protein [Tenacibaculum finnmarkense]MCD8427898.1 hypothetical protein [Tenacibaculum finnmarkense genomovar finnmarkense]